MSDKKKEEEARAEAEAKAKADAEAKAAAEAKTKADAEAGAVTVSVRHKTPNAHYRCAGPALTKKARTYKVTAAQPERLRRDPRVEIEKGKE